MSCSTDVSNYRRKRKDNLVKVAGGRCCLCGYNKVNSALEFHHIISEEKKYGLSTGNTHDLEKDLEELKKCILVCANCHREIHAGLYIVEYLEQKKVYDENYANILREKKKLLREKTLHFCSECGKQLYEKTKTGLCNTCVAKCRRIVDRPSREELKNLIRTTSFVKIGKMYGVSDNTIIHWCKYEGLPCKKKDINNISDEDWILI